MSNNESPKDRPSVRSSDSQRLTHERSTDSKIPTPFRTAEDDLAVLYGDEPTRESDGGGTERRGYLETRVPGTDRRIHIASCKRGVLEVATFDADAPMDATEYEPADEQPERGSRWVADDEPTIEIIPPAAIEREQIATDGGVITPTTAPDAGTPISVDATQAGDLDPDRVVEKFPTSSRIHLPSVDNCQTKDSFDHDPRPVFAGAMWDDTPICEFCRIRAQERDSP
jgi:hypothetical protein